MNTIIITTTICKSLYVVIEVNTRRVSVAVQGLIIKSCTSNNWSIGKGL